MRLLSARVKFCQIPYANFERTSPFLSYFCFPLQSHVRLFLCNFLAQTICTLLKRSPLKWQFLRLSSSWVKFYQIPYANFEMMYRYLSKFCITFQFHEGLLLCTFIAQTIYTLLIRSALKWKSLRLFEHSGQNLTNSFCQFLNDKLILLKVLHPFSLHSSVRFSSNNIYFP